MTKSLRHILILLFFTLPFISWTQTKNSSALDKYVYKPNNLYIDRYVITIYNNNKFCWETFYNLESGRTLAKYMISKGTYHLDKDTIVFDIKRTQFSSYVDNNKKKITKKTNHRKATKKAEYTNKTITFLTDSLKTEKYIKEP